MTNPRHPCAVDQTAILITHAAKRSGESPFVQPPTAGTPHHTPVTDPSPAPHGASHALLEARSLDPDTTRVSRRSARYAAAAFPGPVGELISGEIGAYLDADEPLPPHAMAPRLVAAMASRELSHPLPPIPNLPPRYVPGTPLHFRSPTAADEPEWEEDQDA